MIDVDEEKVKAAIKDCVWDIDGQADHEVDPVNIEALHRIYDFLEAHIDEI